MPFGLAAKSAPPWAWPLGGSAFFPNEGRPGAGVWRGAAQRRPAPPVGCFSSQTSAPLNPMLFQLGFARAAGCSYSSTTGPVAGLAGFRYPRVVARACARRSRLGPFRARPMAPAFAAALIVSWVLFLGSFVLAVFILSFWPRERLFFCLAAPFVLLLPRRGFHPAFFGGGSGLLLQDRTARPIGGERKAGPNPALRLISYFKRLLVSSFFFCVSAVPASPGSTRHIVAPAQH